MTKEKVNDIIKEVYPKIEKYYGYSKFYDCTPYVELHHNIYARYSGEEDAQGDEDGCHAEFDNTDNSIVVYYPNMKSRKHIIETLIHEYQHYLQSPSWFTRYYNMGHSYSDHPYEVAAFNAEKDWRLVA